MADGSGGADGVERAGAALGVLLGGLVGAFSFLGIEGGEVGVVLRNETWQAGAIALLIAGALAASVVSVFVAGLRVSRGSPSACSC
jgi:hypothetical protein